MVAKAYEMEHTPRVLTFLASVVYFINKEDPVHFAYEINPANEEYSSVVKQTSPIMHTSTSPLKEHMVTVVTHIAANTDIVSHHALLSHTTHNA